MKTIRDFFCNSDPFYLTIGSLVILFFGGMGIHWAIEEVFLEYLSVIGIAVGFAILLMAIVSGITAAITWAQSHCEKS